MNEPRKFQTLSEVRVRLEENFRLIIAAGVFLEVKNPAERFRGALAQAALEKYEGNKAAAARCLNIERSTLNRWLSEV